METSCEPALFESGIQTEGSDIRAHVGVAMRTVYVYRTALGLKALNEKEYPVKSAYQPGVSGRTATGWLVPPSDIEDMKTLHLKHDAWWTEFRETDSTSVKGKAAVNVVIRLLKRGQFPLWVVANESMDQQVQIRGTDILLWAHQRIQVKCDWNAGNPEKSGCLYLQQSERNPLKLV